MKGHKINFAVFLAARDGMPWLKSQIKSILKQENVSVKIFINVDLSRDGTNLYCKQLSYKYKNIKVFFSKKLFGNPSKNFFWMFKNIDFRKFDYIALSDQDDVWMPKKLFYSYKSIIKNDCDAYSSNLLSFSQKKKKIIKKDYPLRKYDYLFESAGAGCTYVLKNYGATKFKDFLCKNWVKVNKLKNYDWFIYSFFRFNKLKWFFDKKITIYYRQHEKNFMGANNNYSSFVKRFRMIINGWYRKEVEKNFLILKLINPKKKLLNLYSRLSLIKNFNHLRRKSSDRLFLLFCFIFYIY